MPRHRYLHRSDAEWRLPPLFSRLRNTRNPQRARAQCSSPYLAPQRIPRGHAGCVASYPTSVPPPRESAPPRVLQHAHPIDYRNESNLYKVAHLPMLSYLCHAHPYTMAPQSAPVTNQSANDSPPRKHSVLSPLQPFRAGSAAHSADKRLHGHARHQPTA